MSDSRERNEQPAPRDAAPVRMFFHAPTTPADWLSLEIEAPAGLAGDELKKAKAAADAARQKLADYLHSVLTTPNLLVLAGGGTSLGNAHGPSMADLWTKATKIQDSKLSSLPSNIKTTSGSRISFPLQGRERVSRQCGCC